MIRQETSISELINSNSLSSYAKKTLIVFFIIAMFNGYYFIMSNVLNSFISASFSLSIDVSNPHFMIFMLMGMIVAGIVCGMVSDRIGRRKPLIASVFLSGFFIFLQAFITNPLFFCINQFVIGFFLTASLSIMMTFIVEIAPSNKRSFYNGIVLGGFIFGCFLAAFCAPHIASYPEPLFLEFLTGHKFTLLSGNEFYENWRVCYMGGLLIVIISVVASYIINESPHWYANNGKKQEAALAIYDSCSVKVADDDQIDPSHITIPPKPSSRAQGMLLSKAFASTTIPLWILSFVIMFFIFYLFSLYPYWIQDLGLTVDQFKSTQYICIAIATISCIVAAKLNDVISRRTILTLGWILSIVDVALIAFLLTYPARGTSGILMNIFMGILSIAIGWSVGALTIHFSEKYPPTMRNAGTSWLLSIGGFGAIISISLFTFFAQSSNISFVNNNISDWRLIFLLTCIPLVAALLISIFKIKETKNKTLDDLAQENSGTGTTFSKYSTTIVGVLIIAISLVCFFTLGY